MKNVLLMLMLATLAGCVSTGNRVGRDWPAWAAPQCQQALDEAQAIITAKGVHKIKPGSVRVEFIPGTKRLKAGWCCYLVEPSINGGGTWYMGLTSGNGSLIQIVMPPDRMTDSGAIPYAVLRHEMVHHWLIVSGHGGKHLQAYDDVIPEWSSDRRAVGW